MIPEPYPYPECEKCRSLEDCKHPDVDRDGMGSALPPDCCPKPIDIMRATEKKRRALREGLKLTRDDLS